MATIEKDRILQFRGEDLLDGDGEKIGTLKEVYLDADTGEPEWALIHTGLFGNKRTFVPLAGAEEVDGSLRVPFAKDLVKDAPTVEPNGQLTESEEAGLFRHFGLTRDTDA
jgi:sporulation protein YlmC with PRC-barrel domain